MIVLSVCAARDCLSDPFRIVSLVIAFAAIAFVAITSALRWC
ncbi:MAG: hypothetical protein QM651_01720 [Rhodoblastus sp.]